MPTDYVPAGPVLNGLEIADPPSGVIPLDAIIIIKALDEEGNVAWYSRYTKDLTTAESVGALIGMSDLERQRFMDLYQPGPD